MIILRQKKTADQMEEQRDRMEKETYSLKHELVSTQMKLDGVLKDLEERQRQLRNYLQSFQNPNGN